MAVRNGNKRVMITVTESDMELVEKLRERAESCREPVTVSELYRRALLCAYYADWTQMPLENMDVRDLAHYVGGFDLGVPGSGDSECYWRAEELLVARLQADLDAARVIRDRVSAGTLRTEPEGE